MMQASSARSQDTQSFAQQQALLQKQLADLKLKYDTFSADSTAANDALHKKRLKLQQEVEVLADLMYILKAGKLQLGFMTDHCMREQAVDV